MAFTTTVSSKGGAKLKAVLAQAEKQRAKKIKVGFFSTSEYEDGTKTATVATIQEYGLGWKSRTAILPAGDCRTRTEFA